MIDSSYVRYFSFEGLSFSQRNKFFARLYAMDVLINELLSRKVTILCNLCSR